MVENKYPYVQIKDGKLYLNGVWQPEYDKRIDQIDIEALNEDMKKFDAQRYAVKKPYLVPPNSYFILGDNINDSMDSRDLGAIAREEIRGKVVSVKKWER